MTYEIKTETFETETELRINNGLDEQRSLKIYAPRKSGNQFLDVNRRGDNATSIVILLTPEDRAELARWLLK